MNTKKILITLLASGLTLSIANAETLKISHVRPQDSTIDNDIKALSAAIEKATDGDLSLRIYAANALGDSTTVQERIALGAIDMAVQPAATGADKRMQISALSYLTNNWESAKKVYGKDGVTTKVMKELFAEQDITLLAVYPVYFGGIALNRDAVSPGDPNVEKGIKIRVPGVKSFQLLGNALGYISAPIPFSEAFTAVQTGVVDGVIGSGAEGYYASFRDVTKTYIPLNTHFEAWYLIINTEKFNSLSEKDKEALVKASDEFAEKRWAVAEQDQKANENKLAQNGTVIVEISDEEIAKTAEKVKAEVWPEIINDMGKDWAENILKEVNQQ